MDQDPLVADAENKIESVTELQNELRLNLIPALERAVFQGDDAGLAIKALQIDMAFPIALTGVGTFVIKADACQSEVIALIGVVPQDSCTTLFIASAAANEQYLDDYLKYWCRHALGFLSMVESWMVNGTDQWFITPSVWSALSSERQEKILEKIISSEQNIGQDCNMSIFDELRKSIIRDTEAVNAGVTNPNGLAYMVNEKNKLL
ncbi:hypothetical protein HN51_04125 [Ectopseudomonas mendocina]|uniref:Uncharacterized protein n=2 Tax=Ectopseudomonas mendocina TaxID=300 RepID=A0ABN4IW77_ECTME|nr:hypothetical protein DW68_015955 [Pseudomonas mendocina S5.2]KER99039.1 hypothetical protein HN51_04125 [Pseudomonas mendocina]